MRFDGAIENLLSKEPFQLDENEKKRFFLEAMFEAFIYHLENNELFRNYCQKKGFDKDKLPTNIDEFPYLPVNIFKRKNLSSVPKEEVKLILTSSATSGIPSTIMIDSITSKRQSLVSAKVITSYLGNKRYPFIILDDDPKNSLSYELTARGAATRGFLLFAKEASYYLISKEDKLELNIEKLLSSLKHYESSQEGVYIFGFTYIVYKNVITLLKEKNVKFKLSPLTKLIHIGGWKKLESEKVSKEKFLNDVNEVFGILPNNVIDFYGFTEQMGIVYANCGNYPKVVPIYSEIIIRDFETLSPVKDGEIGLIQFLTPIPRSYPGISILTEDVGKIVGRGKDQFGRYGTQFEIIGRAKGAEVRGCGDIMSELVI